MIDVGKAFGDDPGGGFHVGAGDGGGKDMEMGEDSTGKAERLVEANGANEKGEGLGEGDGVDRDAESHGDGEGEEKSEDAGGKDSEGEPKARAECA